MAIPIDSLPIIPLSDTLTFKKLLPYQIGFLENNENKIVLAELKHQSFNALPNKPSLDIAQQDANFWAVIQLTNITKNKQIWWLEVPGNYVDAWIIRANGNIDTAITGNLLKQIQKTIPGKFRNFNYIPLTLRTNEKIIVQLNIKTSTFFPIYHNAFSIGKPLYFENFQNERLSKNGFYNGLYSAIMFMFCLYCLGYFILTKETFALWASLYGLAIIGYFYQFDSTWYRLGLNPILVQYIGTSLMNFALLFNFLLIRKYLDLGVLFPFWNKVFSWLIYASLAFILLHLLFYYISQHYLLYLAIILIVHSLFYIPLLIVAVKDLSSQQSTNIIFSVGLIFSHVLLLYNNAQLANLSNDLLKIGVSIYILTLFISLSIRAANNQKQKIKAEKERIIDGLKLAELQKLDQLKTNFFTNISHELRTPLTLILGPISSILKNGQLDARNVNLLKKAQESGEDLLKLITTLLDFSKLEAAKIELEEKPISVFTLTRRIATTFEAYANSKNIQYTFVYQAEKDLMLELDKDKVRVILNNLLSNSLKFTSNGGRVIFKVEDTGRTLECTIADSGIGIHPQDRNHIFDRFYQSNQPNALVKGGTGIGLALSKEFALLMKGDIFVKSQLTKGSTFILAIPRKEVFGISTCTNEISVQKSMLNPPILEETNKLIKKTHQLLIVEDNANLTHYLTTILSPSFDIQTATNGRIALSILKAGLTKKKPSLPDLILSDIMMPEMDGFQLLKILKADTSFNHIPVIMLTARVDKKDKLKALTIGVDDYLLKPFEGEELLIRINNLLSNAKQRQEILSEERKMAQPVISKEVALWLKSVEALVKENISNNIFSIPFMANELAMTERSLQRKLKKVVGLTPKQYIQEMRLNKARQLLEERQYSTIAKVAYAVGFSDAKTFSQRFKQRYGKLPSTYF